MVVYFGALMYAGFAEKKCVNVRIEAGVMRCADKMQHWLAETLVGRVECVSHAIFFIFWLNAPVVCVLMRLSGLCLAECVSGNVLLKMQAIFMLQNLFGLGLA